jgi:hypothetical protein
MIAKRNEFSFVMSHSEIDADELCQHATLFIPKVELIIELQHPFAWIKQNKVARGNEFHLPRIFVNHLD